MMSAAEVAKIGYRAFRAGKVVVVPGRLNQCLAFAVRLVPRALARSATARFNR